MFLQLLQNLLVVLLTTLLISNHRNPTPLKATPKNTSKPPISPITQRNLTLLRLLHQILDRTRPLHMKPTKNQTSTLKISLESKISKTCRILRLMLLAVHCQFTLTAILTTPHRKISRHYSQKTISNYDIDSYSICFEQTRLLRKEYNCSVFIGRDILIIIH